MKKPAIFVVVSFFTLVLSVGHAYTKALEVDKNYLKPVYISQKIIIGATDGKETLAEAKDVFSDIDGSFLGLEINVPGEPTAEVGAQSYIVKKDGKFKDFFKDFEENMDYFCLTQSQIKEFCRKHPDKISNKGLTLFLSKIKGNYYLVYVKKFHIGKKWVLRTGALPFQSGYIWHSKYCHNIVVPQL